MERRTRLSRVELLKVNVYKCRHCPRIHFPPIQASKVNIGAGWYPDLGQARIVSEEKYGLSVVIRPRRGRKSCPDCR